MSTRSIESVLLAVALLFLSVSISQAINCPAGKAQKNKYCWPPHGESPQITSGCKINGWDIVLEGPAGHQILVAHPQCVTDGNDCSVPRWQEAVDGSCNDVPAGTPNCPGCKMKQSSGVAVICYKVAGDECTEFDDPALQNGKGCKCLYKKIKDANNNPIELTPAPERCPCADAS